MNNVNLIGRLTKDIELRQTNGGKAVCSFCIAVDGGKDISYFIDCVAWEARATNIAQYFHKGDKIGIAGMITTRTYDTSDGKKIKATEVLVNSFDFCTTKKNEQNEDTTSKKNEQSEDPYANQEGGELPFEV